MCLASCKLAAIRYRANACTVADTLKKPYIHAAANIQVTVCKTGRECVHLLANTPVQHQDTSSGHASPLPLFPFDLILKDHEPPLVDACRLLRRMARDPTLPAVPVVGAFCFHQR